MLTFQQQVLHPQSVVVTDQLQRRRTHTAAAQITPHGKIVQQRRPLARQHDLPCVGQPRTGIIGQQQRLIHPCLQQAAYLGKGLALGGGEIPRQGGAVQLLTAGRGQTLDLHGDFSFL